VSKYSKHEDAKALPWFSRLWRRPTRVIAWVVGLGAAIVGELLKQNGIASPYFETGFTGILVLWVLMAGFRPEWKRFRYWLVLLGITASHIALWVYLERRIGHLGFVPMFALVSGEVLLGATLVAKLIPEDTQLMLEYIRRW